MKDFLWFAAIIVLPLAMIIGLVYYAILCQRALGPASVSPSSPAKRTTVYLIICYLIYGVISAAYSGTSADASVLFVIFLYFITPFVILLVGLNYIVQRSMSRKILDKIADDKKIDNTAVQPIK